MNLIKVRMQLSARPTSGIAVASSVVRGHGFLALWSGLGPALGRQMVYGNLRIGIYNNVGTRMNSTREKLAVGACSGAVAAALWAGGNAARLRLRPRLWEFVVTAARSCKKSWLLAKLMHRADKSLNF